MFKVVKLYSKSVSGCWPIYCMPTATGSVGDYLDFARIIGQDRPVYAVAWKGNSWKKFVSLAELALPVAEAVESHCPAGPYCLFGYSFGGHVAIETARQLAERGAPASLVAVVDQAPHGHAFRLRKRIGHFA